MTALGETILVVDDDPYIQEALGDRLESLGYRVSRASDGQQALELIDHQDPQMVFLDIEMPRMKGLDVLREIRKREKDFPVVIIDRFLGLVFCATGNFFNALLQNADALPHFLHPHHVTVVTISHRPDRNIKLQILVTKVRLVLAQIPFNAAAPQIRAAQSVINRVLLRNNS